jgi:hypothetical protein
VGRDDALYDTMDVAIQHRIFQRQVKDGMPDSRGFARTRGTQCREGMGSGLDTRWCAWKLVTRPSCPATQGSEASTWMHSAPAEPLRWPLLDSSPAPHQAHLPHAPECHWHSGLRGCAAAHHSNPAQQLPAVRHLPPSCNIPPGSAGFVLLCQLRRRRASRVGLALECPPRFIHFTPSSTSGAATTLHMPLHPGGARSRAPPARLPPLPRTHPPTI